MKSIIRQAALMGLLAIFIAVQSMFAFAVTERTTGALTVVGASGKTPIVKVNGEQAVTGRSIFSANLIETTGESTAVISAGQAGRFQLAANSRFIVSFDNNQIGGELLAGQITVLDAPQTANIKINDQTVKLRAGESAGTNQSSGSAAPPVTASSGMSSGAIAAILIGIGAAAALVIGATAGGGNEFQLGSTAAFVSPTR